MFEKLENEKELKINPLFSIWLSPRKTFRYALEHKSLKYSLSLAAISGTFFFLEDITVSTPLWLFILSILVLGPVIGLIILGIEAAINTWIGKLFDGEGNYKEMTHAMGISSISEICLAPFWILSAVVLYNDLFTESFVWDIVYWSIYSIHFIWTVVIHIKGIAEVHKFSSWRGFATYVVGLITIIVLLIPIMIALMALYYN